MTGFFSRLFGLHTNQERQQQIEVYRAVLRDEKSLHEHISTLALQYNSFPVPDYTRQMLVHRYGNSILKLDPATRTWPHRSKAIETMYMLLAKLGKVDLDQVDDAMIESLYIYLTQDLPKTLEEHEHAAILAKEEGERPEHLAKQLLSQVARIIRLPKLTPHINALANKAEEVTANSNPGSIQFPNYDYITDSLLKDELELLQNKWTKLTKDDEYVLTVEEEYTASQVVKTYLPDILSLYRRAQGTKQEEEAYELTLKQLELLHSQLDFVVQNHVDDILSQMKVHTNFLEQKKENMYARQSKGIDFTKEVKKEES